MMGTIDVNIKIDAKDFKKLIHGSEADRKTFSDNIQRIMETIAEGERAKQEEQEFMTGSKSQKYLPGNAKKGAANKDGTN